MKIKTIIGTLIFLCSIQLNAQYSTHDAFSDPNETTNMTRDIFAVWWDDTMDYTVEADLLLNQIIALKEIVLNDFNMQVPQSTIDGYYINVYIHGDGGYYDIYGWGNGLGTDSNGYPYLTLPYFILPDQQNLAHETFHIFQHNLNSSGFYYEGDKQWFTEASANWFASIQNSNAARAFITSEILVRIPNVPLWLGWLNIPPSYPDNWQRPNHQYALGLFLYYLTEEKEVSRNLVSEGFYANTAQLPQEYLFYNIGEENFRNYFIDYAAHMTNDFDFISQVQKDANLQEWNQYADPNDDNEFTEIFDASATNGWYRPDDIEVTNAWSFNTYKLENTENTSYTFEIEGDNTGNNNDPSFFQGKILVKNVNGTATFYDVPMINDFQGSLSVDVTETDSEIYFLIASMPEIFEDNNPEFQLFSYEMRITNNLLNVTDFNTDNGTKVFPNPIKNNLYIKLDNYEEKIDIELFSVFGQSVDILRQTELTEKEIKINFLDISKGIYFLKVSTKNKSNTFKLVKQ